MKSKSKSILFLYPDFYPVNSGHKVHGYNLAKILNSSGYTVYSFNRNDDGLTYSVRRSLKALLKAIFTSRYYYIRVSFNFRWTPFFYLAKLLRKKIIFELNAPPDELIRYGKITNKEKKLQQLDRKLYHFLSKAESIVNVSKELESYCINILKLPPVKVTTIENGGEALQVKSEKLSPKFLNKLVNVKQFEKVFIWSGSINPLQGTSDIENIVNNLPKSFAIIIVSDKEMINTANFVRDNVFIFVKPSRNELGALYQVAHVGLALYKDNYEWSRIGFYQSSLKYFEYLANDLVVYCPNLGGMAKNNPNVIHFSSLSELTTLIREEDGVVIKGFPKRTWQNVGTELIGIMK